MTNSKLASWHWNGHTNNYNVRDHKIDKITIHHMAGNLSCQQAANAVQINGGSWNYCIQSDGKIGVMIDEKYRAWTSSNRENDMRAVTIEVANDKIGGNWHVSDKALASLIALCVDICKRNSIKKLNYTGNANGNLTMHRYFAATACPGEYLASKFPYIANEVNKRLAAKTAAKTNTAIKSTATTSKVFKSYKVKVTADVLNVRSKPTTDGRVTCTVKRNEIYTIVAESNGKGAKKWGKLKSGAGWISLDYIKKV